MSPLVRFEPRFSITNTITDGLTRIERARGFLDAVKLSSDWMQRMKKRALVLEAHHTTHIEGTHLTISQAELLLDGKSIPEADPDDVQELLNFRSAFNYVSSYLQTEAPITEGLIREIHTFLVEGVRGGAAAPGKYRKIQNYVINSQTGETVYTPPPAYDVPVMMEQLINWLNQVKEIHPVLISGIAQFQLVHIHPFLDGNGRVSRLLSTLCLYRDGYDLKRLFTLSEFYDRNRSAFYHALQSVRERGMDLTEWLEYFVVGLATQLSEVHKRVEKVIRTDVLIKKHRLTNRQEKALEYALEHGGLTIQQYESLCPELSRRTLQRDLKSLLNKGLLISEGATSNLVYFMKENS